MSRSDKARGLPTPTGTPNGGIHPTGVDVGMALREGADRAGSQRNKGKNRTENGRGVSSRARGASVL